MTEVLVTAGHIKFCSDTAGYAKKKVEKVLDCGQIDVIIVLVANLCCPFGSKHHT